MKTVVFDGRAFAKKKEESLQSRVLTLKKQGIIPKMVSIVVGDVDGAVKYQEMKKKAGERIGITLEIKQFGEDESLSRLKNCVEELNNDSSVHGIMIQLPLPQQFSGDDRYILTNAIEGQKDVDGMREDATNTPVVSAIVSAFKEATSSYEGKNIVVLGAKGFEGQKIVDAFFWLEISPLGLDKDTDPEIVKKELANADIIISATGVPNVITGDMVKTGVIAIDAGAPQGDFEFESVSSKASFITPVPRGIGPVTIACLMENIVEAARKNN